MPWDQPELAFVPEETYRNIVAAIFLWPRVHILIIGRKELLGINALGERPVIGKQWPPI